LKAKPRKSAFVYDVEVTNNVANVSVQQSVGELEIA